MFLLDGSDDSRNGLPAIREFIRRMAEDLDINEDKVRVAVVQYSGNSSVYFNLKAHGSKKAIVYAVRSLRHKGGRPRNTGAALQFVQDHVFSASSGSRHSEGVPQILFLLTGGKSNDNVLGPALNLKQNGVLTFAIGMKKADQEELKEIAFSSRFLFNLPVFGELLSIQPEMAAFVQAEIQTEPPTVVGKTCHCLVDLNQTDSPLPHSSTILYVECHETASSSEERQSISFMVLTLSPLARGNLVVLSLVGSHPFSSCSLESFLDSSRLENVLSFNSQALP